MINHERLMNR